MNNNFKLILLIFIFFIILSNIIGHVFITELHKRHTETQEVLREMRINQAVIIKNQPKTRTFICPPKRKVKNEKRTKV